MNRLNFAKIKNAGMIVAAFSITLIAGAGAAYAASGNTDVSGTTNHTLYKTGQTVTITGKVNGDIFCVGQTVDVDAEVNGDVICAGQTVTVDGVVHGDVRLAGENVNLGAHVDNNASLVAQTAILQSNAVIGNDIGVAAQTATLDGQTGRDIRATVATLVIDGTVGRNVESTVNSLEVGNHAVIGHDLTYTSPTKVQVPGGANVGGTITYHYQAPHKEHRIMWRGPGVFAHLYTIVAILVFSLVLVAIFPRLFETTNRRAAGRFWATLLTGFIAMIVMPLLMIALLVSVIGVPLAVFTGLLWTIAIFLSAPLSAFFVGRLIITGEGRTVLVMLVGGLVLGFVTLIPVLGWLISLVAMWFGTGSVLLNLKRLHKATT